MALPGSPEKVQVLVDRAARGERLWHPLDATMDRFRTVRVPIISAGNFKLVGWRIITEAEYRAEGHNEPWWGGKQEDDKLF